MTPVVLPHTTLDAIGPLSDVLMPDTARQGRARLRQLRDLAIADGAQVLLLLWPDLQWVLLAVEVPADCVADNDVVIAARGVVNAGVQDGNVVQPIVSGNPRGDGVPAGVHSGPQAGSAAPPPIATVIIRLVAGKGAGAGTREESSALHRPAQPEMIPALATVAIAYPNDGAEAVATRGL